MKGQREKMKKKNLLAVILAAAGILAVAAGIILDRLETSAAISVIGGADGPTSIFVAGKISPSGIAGKSVLTVGIVLLVIAGIKVLKRKK